MKVLRYISIFIMFVLLMVSCEQHKEKGLKIGIILPLTGSAASLGKSALQGAELAANELQNKEVKIKTYVEDSKASPTDAVTIVNRMISTNNIHAILCLTTGETSAIAPICEKNKVLLLTSTISPNAPDLGKYIFRNASNLYSDANLIMDYWQQNNIKNIAIIGLNADAVYLIEDYIKEKFPKRGGQITHIENVDRGTTDFRTILTKMKNNLPDGIYIFGYREIAFVIKQAYELGISTKFFGDPSTENKEILQIAGDKAEGIIYTRAEFDTQSNNPVIASFVKKFKKEYNVIPDVFAAQFYDNIMLLNRVHNVNSTTEDMRKKLLNIVDYEGASGRTSFLSNGDVKKGIALKIIKNGEFVKLNKENN